MKIEKGGERRSICQFCRKPFCCVKDHERESCRQNPNSDFNQKHLSKRKQAAVPKLSSKDFIERHSPKRSGDDDRVDGQRQGSRGSIGSKNSQGSQDSQESSPIQFEKGAGKILLQFEQYLKMLYGNVWNEIITQSYNMSKQFFQHLEESDPLFIADAVLAMNKRPNVVYLPSITPFLDNLKTTSVRQDACKMYAILLRFLNRHLLDNFGRILSEYQYHQIMIRLEVCSFEALEEQNMLNRRAKKERAIQKQKDLILQATQMIPSSTP